VQRVGSILAGVPLLMGCFCSCLCSCHSFASSRSAGDTHMCRQRASDSHLSCRCSSELFLCRLLDAAPVGCQTCTSTGPSFSGFLESLPGPSGVAGVPKWCLGDPFWSTSDSIVFSAALKWGVAWLLFGVHPDLTGALRGLASYVQ